MTPAPFPAGARPPDDANRGGSADPPAPAADFGGVWDLLDALPRSSASEALAASTVEFAAVTAAGRGALAAARPGLGRWLLSGALVSAAFVAGGLAGRATAPDPDRAVLAVLPVVRHLDLVREAGSVTFLTEVARKSPPRPGRLLLRFGPEALERQTREFQAALAALEHDLGRGGEHAGDPEDRAADLRAVVQGLPLEQRVELERAVREFQRLSATERLALRTLAEALADPEQAALRDAAVTWHQWLALARPEDRPEIIAGNTSRRLEWLDWYGRIEGGRGEGGRENRPPPRPPERFDRRGGPEGRFPEGRFPRPPQLTPDAGPPREEMPRPPR